MLNLGSGARVILSYINSNKLHQKNISTFLGLPAGFVVLAKDEYLPKSPTLRLNSSFLLSSILKSLRIVDSYRPLPNALEISFSDKSTLELQNLLISAILLRALSPLVYAFCLQMDSAFPLSASNPLLTSGMRASSLIGLIKSSTSDSSTDLLETSLRKN